MKKLVLFAAVVVAVSFASCKKTAAPVEEVVVDEIVAVDSVDVPADSIVVEEIAVEEAQ